MIKIKNPYLKNVLLALAVVGFGTILLNLTFMFYALVINGVGLLFPEDFAATSSWFASVMMFSISLGLVVGYWFVFKSKLGVIFKATLMTIPTAVILAGVGLATYRWPIIAYSIGAAITAGTLYYFYKTKQPWLYWFAVIVVAIALATMSLAGTDI